MTLTQRYLVARDYLFDEAPRTEPRWYWWMYRAWIGYLMLTSPILTTIAVTWALALLFVLAQTAWKRSGR